MKLTLDIDLENGTVIADDLLWRLLGRGAAQSLTTRLAILAELRRTPGASNAEIAFRVGTSAMTVNRLVRDLGGVKRALEGGEVVTNERGIWAIPEDGARTAKQLPGTQTAGSEKASA